MTKTKTLDDYMNDPDLIHEPEALREVHAIRLKIYDETTGMTVAERSAYFHERAARAMKNFGLTTDISSMAMVTG